MISSIALRTRSADLLECNKMLREHTQFAIAVPTFVVSYSGNLSRAPRLTALPFGVPRWRGICRSPSARVSRPLFFPGRTRRQLGSFAGKRSSDKNGLPPKCDSRHIERSSLLARSHLAWRFGVTNLQVCPTAPPLLWRGFLLANIISDRS